MNVFNRIVVVLLLLLLLVAALLLAVFPLESLAVAQRALAIAGGALRSLETSQFWLFIAARVALALIALALFALILWGELRPRAPQTVRVHTEAGSQAEVTSDSVARRLAWHIDQLADVVSVTPRVRPHGGTVDVFLDLRTSPEIDVRMKTDEVIALTREVVTERMGLAAGRIEVRIEHAPYSEGA